jgi:hypothetical protein
VPHLQQQERHILSGLLRPAVIVPVACALHRHAVSLIFSLFSFLFCLSCINGKTFLFDFVGENKLQTKQKLKVTVVANTRFSFVSTLGELFDLTTNFNTWRQEFESVGPTLPSLYLLKYVYPPSTSSSQLLKD